MNLKWSVQHKLLEFNKSFEVYWFLDVRDYPKIIIYVKRFFTLYLLSIINARVFRTVNKLSGNYWSMNHFLDEINWLVLWEIFTYQQKFPSISAAAYCLFKKVRWISQHYFIFIWLLWEMKIKWCVTNLDIINTALTFVRMVSSHALTWFLGESSTSFYYLITFIVLTS